MTARIGRLSQVEISYPGLMVTALIALECPDISPTEDAESNKKACPNLSFPSPTPINRLLSKSQHKSLIFPENILVSIFKICS